MAQHKLDVMNLNEIASLVKYHNSDLKLKDIQRILKETEKVISYGLETNQKIKYGKLFTIEPVIRKGGKHYNGLAKKKSYVVLDDRLRFKFQPLKQLKDIQNDYKPQHD